MMGEFNKENKFIKERAFDYDSQDEEHDKHLARYQ
jgi:hypothetical protein